MFKATWTETGEGQAETTAYGHTRQEAVANLQATLVAQCQTLGILNDTDPPLEADGENIVCGGYIVGHIT